MIQQVLFIQGGGEDGHEADREMACSLQECLGNGYFVNYPKLHSDDSAPDFGWIEQIHQHLIKLGDSCILIGHSLGASMILKYLTERKTLTPVKAVFLLATPYWEGNEDWVAGLKLQENFAENLLPGVPLFFYHCEDDDEVGVTHLAMFRQKVQRATFREFATGGHQLHNKLPFVCEDIRTVMAGENTREID